MSWKDFFADPDLADGFGSTAGDRANPHRGLDFSHGAGTPIPAYSAGTVVINEWSRALGWILELRTPLGRYVGERHMLEQSPLDIGATVKVGQTVGLVGNTGSASRGNHLCTTNASGQGGVHGYERLVSDPWPHIQAALGSSTAGDTITPITSGDDDMAAATAILGAKNELKGTVFFLPDDGGCVPLKSMDEFNSLVATGALRVVGRSADGEPNYLIRPGDDMILRRRLAIATRAGK